MKTLFVALLVFCGGICQSIGVFPKYVRPGDIVYIQLTGLDAFVSAPVLYGNGSQIQICQKTKFILQWECEVPNISAIGEQRIYTNIRNVNDHERLQYIEVVIVDSSRIGLVNEDINPAIDPKLVGKFTSTTTYRLLNRPKLTLFDNNLSKTIKTSVSDINKTILNLKSNQLKTWIPTTYADKSLPPICRQAISQIDLSKQGVNFLAASDPGISPTTEPRVGYDGEFAPERLSFSVAEKYNKLILQQIKVPLGVKTSKAQKPVHIFIIDTMEKNRIDPFKKRFPDGFEILGHGAVIYSLIRSISGISESSITSYAACDNSGKCSIPKIVNGLCEAIDHKSKNLSSTVIVNLSLSSPDGGNLLKIAIEQAIRYGVIIVTANGNRSNCNGKSLMPGQSCHSFPADWANSILPAGLSGQIITVGALRYGFSGNAASISGLALYDRLTLPSSIMNQHAVYYAPGQYYSLNRGSRSAVLVSGTSISAAYFTGALAYFAGRYPVFPVCLTGGSYVNINNLNLKVLSLANMGCGTQNVK